jgi:hypothetical protein
MMAPASEAATPASEAATSASEAATEAVATASEAAAAVTTAALAAATALAAALAATVTTATLAAAAVAATTTAAAAVISHAVFGFIGVATRTVRDRDRDATPAAHFVAGRARGRRKRNAFAFLEFIAISAFRRRDFMAGTAAGEFVAGWAFGAVLVVAGAAAMA